MFVTQYTRQSVVVVDCSVICEYTLVSQLAATDVEMLVVVRMEM